MGAFVRFIESTSEATNVDHYFAFFFSSLLFKTIEGIGVLLISFISCPVKIIMNKNDILWKVF